MAGAPLSQEEENYVRMSLLLTGISPRGVRALFDREFVPSCLGASIKQEYKTLSDLKIKKIINPFQWNLLFPRNAGVPDSKTFDITLMITLLRNLTQMISPCAGYEKLPAATETTPGADLARIKCYRNYLAHLDDSKVDTTYFSTAWTDITGAIYRLGGCTMKDECDQLKNKPLDQSSIEIERCDEEIKALKESLKNMKGDTVKWNVRDHINKILEKWKDRDQMFVNTRAATHVLKSLKENSCVTITASSGVGKTATLQHVALQMGADGYDILLVTDPGDIVKFHNPNKKTLFVIDDLCGNFSLNLSDLKIWEPVIEPIKYLLDNKKIKIIVACRLQVYQDEKFETLSVFTSCVCNLLSENMCLSKTEKQLIAELYLEEKASQITDLYDLYDCFPLLCKLYHENPAVDIKYFFQNPFSVYEEQVEQLQTKGFLGKYCALALCIVFDNKVNEKIFTEEIDEETRSIIENTCEACKLERGTSRLVLKDELDSLLFTFLKKEEKLNETTENNTLTTETLNFYTTIHDKLFDILAHFFGQKIVYCLIKNAQSRLIRERFSINSKDNIDQLITFVPTKYHQLYMQRIVDDWSKGKLQDVFNNINMKIRQFRLKFLYYLNTFDLCSQHKLANTCDIDEIKDRKSWNKIDICDTVLIHCCSIGDIQMVKWCCNHDVDINRCGSYGRSPLIMACKHGHTEIARMLIDKGADYDKCNTVGESPVLIACIGGYKEIVRMLLQEGADYDKYDSLHHKKPLFIACKQGYTEIVMMLIDKIVENNKCKYCALALCVVFNNKVYEEILTKEINEETKTIIENTCKACKLDRGTSRLILKEAFDSLLNLFLSKVTEPCYTNITENIVSSFYRTTDDYNISGTNFVKIFEFLVFYFGKKIIHCLIQNADSHLIRTRFLFERKDNIDHLITIVPTEYHEMYIQRITEDWSKGKLQVVFKNININIQQFRQKLLYHLKTLDKSYQKKLAHTCEDKSLWTMSDVYMGVAFDTVMQHCCFIGDIPLFKWCCNFGVDVKQCNNYGQSPLMMASTCGYTEIVRKLLEKGADYNKCDNHGNSPLMAATGHGHAEIVRMLIDNGDDFNKWCRTGESHVMMGCRGGHTELVRMLLKKGSDHNKCDKFGQSPVMIAAGLGHTEIVRMLLNKDTDYDKCDIYGQSSVMLASMYGQLEIVKMLCEKEVDCNRCDNMGNSILMKASGYGHAEIVKILLDKGADCNNCEKWDQSSIMIACEKGQSDIARMLLDRGGDFNKCGSWGQSPVMMACRNGHITVVKMLIDEGVDYTKCNNVGQSPVLNATIFGHTEIVRMLLDKGADFDECDNNGQSPLMVACRYGHRKIVKILLDKGADYNKCDNDGNSSVMISCCFGHKEIVKFLLEIGADETKRNNIDKSPVMIACEYGRKEILKMLIDIQGDYNKCESRDQSLLLMSCLYGHIQLVRMLLENGADYNKCDVWGQSPLLMASRYGHTEIVRMLLEIGSDYDKCDIYGNSPVMMAFQMNYAQIVGMFVDTGADYTACDIGCENPVLLACEIGQREILKMLLDRGEDCNKCAGFQMSPIMMACTKGHTELVKMLLDNGADFHKCDFFGDIPVMKACKDGHKEIVRMLIEKGADYNMCGSCGESLFKIACEFGHTGIVQLLLDKGADHNKCDMFGESPLEIASKRGHHDIVSIINEM